MMIAVYVTTHVAHCPRARLHAHAFFLQDDLRAAQQQIFTRLEKADTDANDGTSLLAMQTGLFRLLQGAAPVMILQRTFVD